MTSKRHDPSIPRQMYWSDELNDLANCPKCQAVLEKEKQTYVVGIRDQEGIKSFVVENEGGAFCPSCPTVVLDTNIFAQITVDGDAIDQLRDINVAGLVDTAVMPEALNLTLRESNNSLPLIEFLPRSKK